jgi:hypothetical protein
MAQIPTFYGSGTLCYSEEYAVTLTLLHAMRASLTLMRCAASRCVALRCGAVRCVGVRCKRWSCPTKRWSQTWNTSRSSCFPLALTVRPKSTPLKPALSVGMDVCCKCVCACAVNGSITLTLNYQNHPLFSLTQNLREVPVGYHHLLEHSFEKGAQIPMYTEFPSLTQRDEVLRLLCTCASLRSAHQTMVWCGCAHSEMRQSARRLCARFEVHNEQSGAGSVALPHPFRLDHRAERQ